MLDPTIPQMRFPACYTVTEMEETMIDLMNAVLTNMTIYNTRQCKFYLSSVSSALVEQVIRRIIQSDYRGSNAPFRIRIGRHPGLDAVLVFSITMKPYAKLESIMKYLTV